MKLLQGNRFLYSGGFLLASSCVLATSAQAAGFQLLEQSVTGLGRSFAGSSLAADDVSAAFYNPADMWLLGKGNHLQAGATYLKLQNHFKGTYTSPLPGASGADTESSSTEGTVPHLHWASSLNDNWRMGFSISAPFGLATEYNSQWLGCYETTKSEITTTDINPSLAYKISDQFYVGAGLSWQYADARLEQRIHSLSFAGAPLFLVSATDGRATITGDDASWGYNLGATWVPHDDLRLSLTYRSKVEHTLDGERDISGLTDAAAVLNGIEKGSADLNLPETITFNVWQKLDDRMAAMFSLRHTEWSRYKELRVVYDNSALADTVETQNWNDTWSASFGTDYQLNDTLRLRAGLGYDESPVPSSNYRSPRLPSTYNIWLSAGLSWQLSKQMTMDFAYMYVDGKNANVNYTGGAGQLSGEYRDVHAHEIGAQLQYHF